MTKIRLLRNLVTGLTRGAKPRLPVSISAEAESDCYGYGLSPLMDDGSLKFRWSHRYFGFYLAAANVQTIRLHVVVYWPTRLTCALCGATILDQALNFGEQFVDIQIPKALQAPEFSLDFALSRIWFLPTKQGRRQLGVQLVKLWMFTATDAIEIPAQNIRHNASRSELQQFQRLVSSANKAQTAPVFHAQSGPLNLQERSNGLTRLESGPLKLYVEIAWQCNLRCPSCFHAYIGPAHRKDALHFMSPFLFETIRHTLFPGALMVWYNGNGESLLHPAIDLILASAQDYSFIPAILTNGSLFNETNMRLLVEGGYFVSISVDSPQDADFARLRKGAKLSRLVAAITYMQELKAQLGRDRFNLRIQCVAQQSNLHQLSDLVRWAAAYGISEVQFLPLHNFGMPYTYLENALLSHTPQKANTEMLSAIHLGTRLGVRVRPFPPVAADQTFLAVWHAAVLENLSNPTPMESYFRQARYLAEHPSNNRGHQCYLAWSECFFGVDGTVAPCDLYLKETTVGNMYDDDFWSIWNGPGMSAIRKTVNDKPVGLCRHGTCIFRPASRTGSASFAVASQHYSRPVQ